MKEATYVKQRTNLHFPEVLEQALKNGRSQNVLALEEGEKVTDKGQKGTFWNVWVALTQTYTIINTH